MPLDIYDNAHASILKNQIRDKNSTPSTVKSSIVSLSYLMSENVLKHSKVFRNFETPMATSLSGNQYEFRKRIVVTTSADSATMGEALSESFGGCPKGYMDFEGRRALEALNQPVRHIYLPSVFSGNVDELIIGKTVLATGCTAISLTKKAIEFYKPSSVYIISMFYSQQGINDLQERFPNVTLILCGDCDKIRSDGMLVPGVGNMDERLNED